MYTTVPSEAPEDAAAAPAAAAAPEDAPPPLSADPPAAVAFFTGFDERPNETLIAPAADTENVTPAFFQVV